MNIALVDCDRRKLRLTETACASLWRQSNPTAPPAWEGRHACHHCPMGAKRNGTAIDPRKVARGRLALVCPRCCNPSDRMIKGQLCVSCYNRQAEVRRGYDRKGSLPGLTGRLCTVKFQLIRRGRAQAMAVRGVTGMIEAAMCVARQSGEPIVIGRQAVAG